MYVIIPRICALSGYSYLLYVGYDNFKKIRKHENKLCLKEK